VICRACKQDPNPDDVSAYKEEARLLYNLSSDTDGIVIYPTAHPENTPILQKLADTRNLVVLDRIPMGLEADCVVSDNFEVTYRAIQTLISRGHKRIGFFSFKKPSFSTVTERFCGYEKALAEAGISNGGRHVRWFPRELDNSPEVLSQAVYDSLFTLVRQSEPITALFCVQDSFAAATLHACEEMQIQVPENLEIATFNDWPPMMLGRPWQTHRIVQNSFGIGLAAGQILARRIAGSKEARSVHKVRAEFYVAGAGLQPDMITEPERLEQ
jgi:DNA-binding LacI/PurR family transcriptional regulator